LWRDTFEREAGMTTERLGLAREPTDRRTLERAVDWFRERHIALPTFAQLAQPLSIPDVVRTALRTVGPDAPDPLNLFRVHWHNGTNRVDTVSVPDHLVLPRALTGVDARIVVALGNRFPLIGAHKVLAAYACLVPRVVTGGFDPSVARAVWPSTGNYCRGGVAISRLLGCRGVAVLPEGMSRERFAWLEQWVADPADIVRTPGTESNVKEIYDRCKELAADPVNVVLNQFAEFGNHVAHYCATGAALERVFESLAESEPGLRLRAFVAATGSAGTLGAGDYLKERFGSLTAACEALECPTMLRNGFGEHNIQGIGDKHIPLIHNVMGTDVAIAISDRATDRLGVLFNDTAGREYLRSRRAIDAAVLDELPSLGLSSICNVLGAIKLARYYGLGADDVVVTVATDGADMYGSERTLALTRHFPTGFDEVTAAEVFGEHLLGATTDNLLELTHAERDRIFNLGYYTWVEQQGVSLADFEQRRTPAFWDDIHALTSDWDALIDEFNRRTGALEGL
jgi:cysteine synthase